MHAADTDNQRHASRRATAPWRTLLALWMVVMIGVVEPAACIVHCAWWLDGDTQPVGAHQHHAQGHQHHGQHEHEAQQPFAAVPVAGAAAADWLQTSADRHADCHELAPGMPPAQDFPVAVHDCITPEAPATLAVHLPADWPPPIVHPPPNHPAEPPFHPPISASA